MARKLRVWVNHTACVGNAMCETIAIKSFRLNDNRQSEAIDPPEGSSTVKSPVSMRERKRRARGSRNRPLSLLSAPTA